MRTSNFKSNTLKIPTYLDGLAEVLQIGTTNDDYSKEYIYPVNKSIYFEELSISDYLRNELDQREIKITIKIRISQTREITSKTVLKIGNHYHKVFNAFHFKNKDGFKQTDLTLEQYEQPYFKEDVQNVR